jgi:hypothetical protein
MLAARNPLPTDRVGLSRLTGKSGSTLRQQQPCVALPGAKEHLALLCRLLILVQRLMSQFDGEEGLHAGVQIEGFAGPAGSDDAGVGVLEAVHVRELIVMGLLLLAAECKVKMPS